MMRDYYLNNGVFFYILFYSSWDGGFRDWQAGQVGLNFYRLEWDGIGWCSNLICVYGASEARGLQKH